MGKQHRRKLLPQALEELADERRVIAVSVAGGTRYEFTESVQGEQRVQGLLPQMKGGERSVQGERASEAVSIENRVSQRDCSSTLSCQKWYDGHVERLLAQGDGTVDEVAVREAGIAAGYNKNQLYVASSTRRKREGRLLAAGCISTEREASLAV